MHLQMIEFSKLVADPVNVRRADTDVDDLAASIRAKGIVQPIRVRPDPSGGHFRVTAGNRRFRAVGKLIADGAATDDYQLPAIVVEDDDDEARAASLAENIIRRPMEPMDEFEAFVAMRDTGSTVADIALWFGTNEKRVRQRLALGDLAPELRDAVRADALSLDAAKAFTLAPDHDRQISIYNELRVAGVYPQAWNVRRRIEGEKASDVAGLLKFVGKEAYLAAGGRITEDLFEDRAVISDPDLLIKVTKQKIEAEILPGLQAEGWKWISYDEDLKGNVYSWHRVYRRRIDLSEELEAERAKIIARIDEIEAEAHENDGELTDEAIEELEALEERRDEIDEGAHDYTAEDKAHAGVRISLEYGRIDISKGLIDPADEKSTKKVETDDGPKPLSAALLSDWSAVMTDATALAIADNPALAEAVAIASLAIDTDYSNAAYYSRPCRVSNTLRDVQASPENEAGTELADRYAAAFEPFKSVSFGEAVCMVMAMEPEERARLHALLVARSITLHGTGYGDAGLQLIALATPDVIEIYQPGEDDLKRMNKDQLADVIADCGIDDTDIATMKAAKKGDMVRDVAKVVKASGWLPEMLRSPAYKPPMREEFEGVYPVEVGCVVEWETGGKVEADDGTTYPETEQGEVVKLAKGIAQIRIEGQRKHERKPLETLVVMQRPEC